MITALSLYYVGLMRNEILINHSIINNNCTAQILHSAKKHKSHNLTPF